MWGHCKPAGQRADWPTIQSHSRRRRPALQASCLIPNHQKQSIYNLQVMPWCRRRADGRDLTREWMEGRKGGKLVTNRHARIQDFFENFWGNPFYFNMGHFLGHLDHQGRQPWHYLRHQNQPLAKFYLTEGGAFTFLTLFSFKGRSWTMPMPPTLSFSLAYLLMMKWATGGCMSLIFFGFIWNKRWFFQIGRG